MMIRRTVRARRQERLSDPNPSQNDTTMGASICVARAMMSPFTKIEYRVIFRQEILRRPFWATSQQNSITKDTITACMHARSPTALLYRGSLIFVQGSWCGGRTTRNILLGGGRLSSFVRLVSTVDIEYTNGLPFLPKVGEGDGNPYPLGRRPRPKWWSNPTGHSHRTITQPLCY